MADKLKHIAQAASFIDDFKKNDDPAKISSAVSAPVQSSDATSAELCVAETLSTWKDIEKSSPQAAYLSPKSETNDNLNIVTEPMPSDKMDVDYLHSDTDSSRVVASESTSNPNSVSSISPHQEEHLFVQGTQPREVPLPTTSIAPSNQLFTMTVPMHMGNEPKNDESAEPMDHHTCVTDSNKSTETTATLTLSDSSAFVSPAQLKNTVLDRCSSVHANNASEGEDGESSTKNLGRIITSSSQIVQGARFASYLDFITTFNAWKNMYHHPFRVASSEGLREPHDGSLNETFRYRYVVYHCAFYGHPRKRGNGKRPNQNYMPCGCDAMLRLNFNHNECCLKITTLKNVHRGHEVSSENFQRVSSKMRRFSPASSIHSSEGVSSKSIMSNSSLAVKHSRGRVKKSNSNASANADKSLMETPSGRCRAKKSTQKQQPTDQDSMTHQQESCISEQKINDVKQSHQLVLNSTDMETDTLNTNEYIEQSLMAAASAMSVKASSAAGSSSSKSSQSYSNDSRPIHHSYPSSSISSSQFSGVTGNSLSSTKIKQPIDPIQSENKFPQPPQQCQQMRLDAPAGSTVSGSRSSSFSTNLLSPHTPLSEELNTKCDKDLTNEFLMSFFEDPSNYSKFVGQMNDPQNRTATSVPLDLQSFLLRNSGISISEPSVLSNLSSQFSTVLNTQSHQPVSFHRSYESPNIQNGANSLPTTTAASESEQLLSNIFLNVINQTHQQQQSLQQPSVNIPSGNILVQPKNSSNFLTDLINGKSKDSGISANSNTNLASINPYNNYNAQSYNPPLQNFASTESNAELVAKIQALLSDPPFANMAPNVLASLLTAPQKYPNVQPQTTRSGNGNIELLLALQNMTLPTSNLQQGQQFQQQSQQQQPSEQQRQQELFMQQLLLLQQKCGQNIPSVDTKNHSSQLVVSNPNIEQIANDSATSVQQKPVHAEGEKILQHLRDMLYTTKQTDAFVASLKQLYDYFENADKPQ